MLQVQSTHKPNNNSPRRQIHPTRMDINLLGRWLAAPLLGFVSTPLDRGPHQTVIALAATVVSATFSLPAGFFRTVWIFPPYIAAIVAARLSQPPTIHATSA
ncbi:hypothetical protein PanWU01x14_295200 [Parasponia andersonii]|uniref:Uncharacterized protein n=1 Tax=Parasponia andersonii TaxID=3476 RepID=A0A2P5AW12_PARAD|nr:hypothetical protein PanWU01x14_295200 [Parasponia andersonii]